LRPLVDVGSLYALIHRGPAIRGILCRGQISVDNLQWDLERKKVEVTLTSGKDQTIDLMMRRGMKEVSTDSRKSLSLVNDTTAKVDLKKQVPVTLIITLM